MYLIETFVLMPIPGVNAALCSIVNACRREKEMLVPVYSGTTLASISEELNILCCHNKTTRWGVFHYFGTSKVMSRKQFFLPIFHVMASFLHVSVLNTINR